MKFSDLAEKIKTTANESAEKLDDCSGTLRVSMSFISKKYGNLLIGAYNGCDYELGFTFGEKSEMSNAHEAEVTARISDAKGVFLSADLNCYRSAPEVLVYYYKGEVPEPSEDTSNEAPWLIVAIASATDSDYDGVVIERAIIDSIISFFGEEHFRFEVY